MMKLLYLHGLESGPLGTKVRHLQARGFDVHAPQLPTEAVGDLLRSGPTMTLLKTAMQPAIDVAGRAVAAGGFDVVVGSSFGGAVALAVAEQGYDGPLLLLAPAGRTLLGIEALRARRGATLVLHARQDDVVPCRDSLLLVEKSAGHLQLWLVDDNHRLERSLADGTIEAAVRVVAG